MTWLLVVAGIVLIGAVALASGWWMRRRVVRRHPPVGQIVRVDGARLHVVVRGEGRAVVFLHGCDGEFADFTGRLLDRAARDFRVVIFDRPGYGYSSRPAGRLSIAAQVELLRAALAQLEIEQPVLVAHGWSAYLALAWALEHRGELSGLVLLNPLCSADEHARTSGARRRAIARASAAMTPVTSPLGGWRMRRKALRARFAPEPVPAGALDAMLAFELWRPAQRRARAGDLASAHAASESLTSRYAELELPVLIVVGDQDRVASPSRHGYRLHNQLHQSRLTVLERAGHMIHLTRPGAVMEAIHAGLMAGVAE